MGRRGKGVINRDVVSKGEMMQREKRDRVESRGRSDR